MRRLIGGQEVLDLRFVGQDDFIRNVVDAVKTAESATRHRSSIVNGSIVSAIEGRFGDHHRTPRTFASLISAERDPKA